MISYQEVSRNRAICEVETDLKQGTKLFFEFKVGLAHDDPDIKLGVGLTW
jgi:hypothetical protein